MGLDGGTYITRSDILRGQSWAVANADGTRSTRGGAINASTTFKRRQLDAQAARRAISHSLLSKLTGVDVLSQVRHSSNRHALLFSCL